MCSICAEYIDGNWFCPDCAILERKIAAGLDYRDFISVQYAEPTYREDATEKEIGEDI
jgi:hypothetical protein